MLIQLHYIIWTEIIKKQINNSSKHHSNDLKDTIFNYFLIISIGLNRFCKKYSWDKIKFCLKRIFSSITKFDKIVSILFANLIKFNKFIFYKILKK